MLDPGLTRLPTTATHPPTPRAACYRPSLNSPSAKPLKGGAPPSPCPCVCRHLPAMWRVKCYRARRGWPTVMVAATQSSSYPKRRIISWSSAWHAWRSCFSLYVFKYCFVRIRLAADDALLAFVTSGPCAFSTVSTRCNFVAWTEMAEQASAMCNHSHPPLSSTPPELRNAKCRYLSLTRGGKPRSSRSWLIIRSGSSTMSS